MRKTTVTTYAAGDAKNTVMIRIRGDYLAEYVKPGDVLCIVPVRDGILLRRNEHSGDFTQFDK